MLIGPLLNLPETARARRIGLSAEPLLAVEGTVPKDQQLKIDRIFTLRVIASRRRSNLPLLKGDCHVALRASPNDTLIIEVRVKIITDIRAPLLARSWELWPERSGDEHLTKLANRGCDLEIVNRQNLHFRITSLNHTRTHTSFSRWAVIDQPAIR